MTVDSQDHLWQINAKLNKLVLTAILKKTFSKIVFTRVKLFEKKNINRIIPSKKY